METIQVKTHVEIIQDSYGYKSGEVVPAEIYAAAGCAGYAGWKLPNGRVAWVGNYDTETALKYGYTAHTITRPA